MSRGLERRVVRQHRDVAGERARDLVGDVVGVRELESLTLTDLERLAVPQVLVTVGLGVDDDGDVLDLPGRGQDVLDDAGVTGA
mgnify:CR=1 FL=1